MLLSVASRAAGKKSELNKIRREGNIPAVLYSRGEKSRELLIQGGEFQKMLNSIVPGTLSSKIFTLKLEGKEIQAIIKDIQYQPTTYKIIHLDLETLHEGSELKLNIPVMCVNTVDCAGVKLGGVIRQVIRHAKVRCMPKKIPQQFELDVQNLGLGQSLKLSDIEVPSGVKMVGDTKQIAVVIMRR